ncbi:hypothetical protein BN59_01220 [Legionella massiliensis]|uniref:DUF2157 domain-containing protein n=1 Tax=Legionella massiliensis TaxID=1034943 RepID=A0A078KVC0_9GAMM|nr:hypothetical protein [Legionella massiliensis]CDZ76941.1 hypothetical protein BN59_01220 [Legionella massiliensis]CEE12679.1 hypothetical protein BN1094_01220 [Legionella massiliensis]
MNISHDTLAKAVEAKIISEQQAESLLTFLQNQPEQSPRFNITNVLYYLGGLIAICAMTLFMTLGWETFGGWGIFFISLIYAFAGLYLSSMFKNKDYPIPAGICATFVVALTPLAIYGLQRGMGWWPDDSPYRDYHYYIQWHWIFMELGTLLVGLILAWIYRYPFMVMPIAVTLWYMSMDLTSMIAVDSYSFDLSAKVSLYFGLATLLLALWVDVESRHSADYAFWLYLFGVITFWGGLSCLNSNSELSKFLYMCINLLLIGVGLILVRKVFVIFGGLGFSFYLGHLADAIFKDSLLFPFALTFIGLAIIYLGTLWQKHEVAITNKMQSFLPKVLQELLQARHYQ